MRPPGRRTGARRSAPPAESLLVDRPRAAAVLVSVLVSVVLLLPACSVWRQPAPPPADETLAARLAFENKQQERASTLRRQGRLAEAAVATELLVLIRPDLAEYREQAQTLQQEIDAQVADRLERAADAQRRGELEAAVQGYLAVLALKPGHAQAADALRAVERERVQRTLKNRGARFAAPRFALPPARPASEAPAEPAPAADRNDLEHAAMLTIQGEHDAAIQLLERRLAGGRGDDVARMLLADAYFQKAEELAGRDRAAAIAALENTVRLYPAHPLAAARLKQLRQAAPAR